MALRATILPLPLTTISDLAIFDEMLLAQSHRVTDHAGGGGEGDIQHAVTEHDRINFAMRVRLTIKKQRMEMFLRGKKNPGLVWCHECHLGAMYGLDVRSVTTNLV